MFWVWDRVSYRMSCEESAVYFANPAYIPHFRQNHPFPPLFIIAFVSQVKTVKILV